MTKYRNQTRAAEEDAELERLEAEYNTIIPVETPETIPEGLDKEEQTWKQRHGELRSYSQRQQNALQAELAEIKRKLEEKERDSRPPVNKAELEDWVREYPDLARVLGTMMDERAERHVVTVSDEVQDVKRQLEAERTAMARERAIHEIIKVHPDFTNLIERQEFKDWVMLQPLPKTEGGRGPRIGQALYDALYNNETDAEAAIEAVNMYKSDKSEPKPRKDVSREAASAIRRTTTSTPTTTNGKRTFAESEIERMNSRDFDKLEEEIEEARRDGRIVYDLSGAAR